MLALYALPDSLDAEPTPDTAAPDALAPQVAGPGAVAQLTHCKSLRGLPPQWGPSRHRHLSSELAGTLPHCLM